MSLIAENFNEMWPKWGYLLALALLLVSAGFSQLTWRGGRRVSFFLFPIALGVGLAWWAKIWVAGLIFALTWMIFPFVQMLILTRRHRVKRHRTLESLMTVRSEFEAFRETAYAWEQLGFENIEDCELKPSDPRQVFRFLVSKDRRFFVVVGLIGQEQWSFIYSAISCWSKDNEMHWMTWNYPLPYGLQLSPELRLWRCTTARTPELLLEQHLEFLRLNQVEARVRPELENAEEARRVWSSWFERQMDYNLRHGWLRLTKEKGLVRYSWRGTLGALGQIFRVLLS
ncbi:MAG: hypothetical protein K1X66_02525 [Verrucomicrobiae bacterium]|nr:hypothetical protein [Verrucomicrobiae bacterium]